MIYIFIVLINFIALVYTCNNNNKIKQDNDLSRTSSFSESSGSTFKSKFLPQKTVSLTLVPSNSQVSAAKSIRRRKCSSLRVKKSKQNNTEHSNLRCKVNNNNQSTKNYSKIKSTRKHLEHPLTIVDYVKDPKIKSMKMAQNLPSNQKNYFTPSQKAPVNTFNKLVEIPPYTFACPKESINEEKVSNFLL